MKTAMQELIEAVNQHYSNPLRGDIFDTNPFLEKEKEQIMDAFSRGLGTELSDWETSEQYYERIYNQTYNQKQHIIDIMKADEEDGLYNQNK
jgi:hypothetical protein